jgi:PAS domain S-box-containing protein
MRWFTDFTSQLSLSQKGLIVLAMPLALQLVLMVWLIALNAETERNTAMIENAKQISDGSTDFLAHNYAAAALALTALESDGPLDSSFGRNIDLLIEDGHRLLNLLDTHSDAKYRVDKILRASKQMLKETDNGTRGLKSKYPEGSEGRKVILSQLPAYGHELEALVAETRKQQQVAESDFKTQLQARQYTQFVVVVITIINAALVSVMFVLFRRDVINRLNRINSNSMLIASGRPLPPPMVGNDEIVRLDNVFHDMSRIIFKTSQKERAMVENVRDVICSLNSKGTFEEVSAAAEQVFGYSPGELIGSKISNLVSNTERSDLNERLQAVMKGANETTFEMSVRRKDGFVVDVLWSAVWEPNEGTLFCVAHDISERRQAERMRQELVQMVTHDLRSPLTSVQGILDMIVEGRANPGEVYGNRMVTVAQRSVARMIFLVNDLLDIEKMHAGMFELQKKDVSVASIFEQSSTGVETLYADTGIKLVCEDHGLMINADPDRLVQILINLFSNALKFSGKGTTVVAEAEQIGDCVEFTVRDQGRGIPKEQVSQVFERFQQVSLEDRKKNYGTGLGLTICKSLVELHGGDISVVSEEGKGSTFSFRIPSRSTVRDLPGMHSEVMKKRTSSMMLGKNRQGRFF